MDYPTLWFVLLGVLLAGYAVLDGFDLGVGLVHPLHKSDHDRRLAINSIGPLWDGNEVWLVTFGGALFAAFPEAYATAFSGFYFAFMAALGGLIFRAVSIEFRGKVDRAWWRLLWDGMFFLSSLVTTLVYGAAVGAAMAGVPLDNRGIMASSTLEQIGPFSLMVAALTVAAFALHGSLYLGLKTTGALRERTRVWAWFAYAAYVVLFFATTAVAVGTIDRATKNFDEHPWGAVIVLLNLLAVLNLPRCLTQRRYGQAFVSSGCSILALVFLFGFALFPELVASSTDPADSLTIYNSASSPKTLRLMALFALIGLPFVLAYTSVVYWTFRGKVQIDKHSY
ncbi:Cytochrome bd-I ubiquinol oxidase subunit 2 [Botrimarina colliarenosi]|uniref:Cytochrome bd-I ubiquinol oxidase subunit 2 n=1 Tax=Botrimarina colliarenosi TaxID=2528001 RepID=A0A5C6APU5_9BACT|nr:cytochrome d ubiquinol oxidase subunit II [Botrimarina colliarenosi]TWU00214.1 Cytochrome bd-I ubiquinol oxidase subunit 2 [Botrimarina colliarenosi]